MRYIKRTRIEELTEKYDLIVGWGNSPLELHNRLTAFNVAPLDCIINGAGVGIGDEICGLKVVKPDSFLDFSGKICFVLFTNLETLLLEQISQLYPQADNIVSRLVDFGNEETRRFSYSRDYEDVILLDLCKKLSFPKEFPYMDIGVCHPVVRNNTYLLYENGFFNGYLVEPNPEMAELAQYYREKNQLIMAGAGNCEGELPYVRMKDRTEAGLNHFRRDDEIIDEEIFEEVKLPIYEINDLLENKCSEVPWLIDIDCEGMDYTILKSLDLVKNQVKIICAERGDNGKIYELLLGRDFIHYTDTYENSIYVRRDIYAKLKK